MKGGLMGGPMGRLNLKGRLMGWLNLNSNLYTVAGRERPKAAGPDLIADFRDLEVSFAHIC